MPKLLAPTSLLTLLLAGCIAPSSMRAKAPLMPTHQVKGKLARQPQNPIVTEWPASEKANLEATIRQGAAAVAFKAGALRILPACRVRGYYVWQRTTTSTDVIEASNEDELRAKLPLAASILEAELRRSGRIAVQTTVSGQYVLQGLDFTGMMQSPGCLGATHVLSRLAVGAFKLRSGGAISGSGSVSTPLVGGGVGTSSQEIVLRQAGDPSTCQLSTPQAPHPACQSPIQLFLQPLPSALVDRGAPGTVKARFLGVTGGEHWDVVVGDRKLCTAPCDRWVDPLMPFSYRHEGGFLQKDDIIRIPDLRDYQSQAPLTIKAAPRSMPKFAGGVTGTTFGGLGVATGITLMAVGCSRDDMGGMCTAGAITLPIGALLTAGSIYLIVDSAPTTTVRSATAPRQVHIGGVF